MSHFINPSAPVAGWKRRAFEFCALFLLLLITAIDVIGQAPKRAFNEVEVKMVSLFNFTQFVEWPAEAFTDSNAPIVIGILGKDPFGSTLDAAVKGELVRNRNVIIARYEHVDEIKECHVLFISSTETRSLELIFQALAQRPILTVGETDVFAKRGGMMRFLTEGNRVRLRINVKAARRAGLSINSNLLRAAKIVETEGKR